MKTRGKALTIGQARKLVRLRALMKVRKNHAAKAMRAVQDFDEKLGLAWFGEVDRDG